MGVLYDVYKQTKKRCSVCGCNLEPKHDGDICEVCLDDMKDTGEEERD